MSHMHDHDTHQHHEPEGIDRRSFLKAAGFTFAGAMAAGCQQASLDKAIPYLIQPEEITPGTAYWFATTCPGCPAGCGVLIKCREGRPIKFEGNPDHPVSRGGLCAMGQASLLGLYDSHRLSGPLMKGASATWQQVDEEVVKALTSIRQKGGAVRVLTGTVNGPTARATIERFVDGFKNARHVEYDAISRSAILDAHAVSHGRRVLPRYRFGSAEVIVSFDADFLGTWISPVEFTKGYRSGRTLEGEPPRCSYHAQVESGVSLTGSNADERFCMAPDEMKACLNSLAASIAARAGQPSTVSGRVSPEGERVAHVLAERLWNARGRSLVVCGTNDRSCQLMVNSINHALGNYGTTVDIDAPSHQAAGSDEALQTLLDELRSGSVAALVIAGANPVYDLPDGAALAKAMEAIPVVISLSERLDETASGARFVCPVPHPLESWSDHEPVAGVAAVSQPTIPPLKDTRPLTESLAIWSGSPAPALDLIRETWKRKVYPRSGQGPFESFWTGTLNAGSASISVERRPAGAYRAAAAADAWRSGGAGVAEAGGMSLSIVPSLTMFDGRHGHNPWLQELADPVTKVVWGNVASVSRRTAERLGVENGDVLRIQTPEATLELPAYIQPGQHDDVVTVTLGYGRAGTDRFTDVGPSWLQSKSTVASGETVGCNAAVCIRRAGGTSSYLIAGVSVTATGRTETVAVTQEYPSLYDPDLLGLSTGERRPIVQEATLAAYTLDRAAGRFHQESLDSMWSDDHSTTGGHRWGMAIDLTACTGCSACVIGCQAENNIPVVGKDEVKRNRELAWLRIDRYYDESDGGFSVAHQPMMCQHCAHAPCETVCPVLATVHNSEGLNQQVYNRCVGTRYCANNCPYKMRRFNWFQYRHGDELQKMVLNPDVTVRDRGVMEKCSFCIQRISLAKLDAKREGRPLRDGDIQPACAQSCPAQAIVFGDINDPASRVSGLLKDPRKYRVLDELGVRPSVNYLTLVRNRASAAPDASHHS